jgi:hypothetical protein
MGKIEMITYTLFAHWASALINGDESGMEETEITEMNNWLNAENPGCCVGCSNEPYFKWRNDASNLGGDVLDYTYFKQN